ncbi:Hypothetical predicted protein [Cloeon dipterum]|nr:Hypothetical predicted protein [Cloeon dipterum]
MRSSSALFTFSFCLLVSLAAAATSVKDCRTSIWNSKVGVPPLNITLNGCDKYPCVFRRNSNITGEMDFMYDKDLRVLIPEVTANLLVLSFDLDINQDDGCDTLSMNRCPIKANTRARYQFSMYVKSWIPLVSANIWFKFKDEKGNITICVEVPVEIVDNTVG